MKAALRARPDVAHSGAYIQQIERCNRTASCNRFTLSEKNSLRLYAFGASNIFILPMEKLTNINARAVLQPRFQLQASDSAARSMFKSIHFCEGTNQTCKHTTATIHKLGRRFTIRQQKKNSEFVYDSFANHQFIVLPHNFANLSSFSGSV